MSLLNGFQSLGGSLGTLAGNMLADEQAKLLRPKPLLETAATEPVAPPETPPVAPVADAANRGARVGAPSLAKLVVPGGIEGQADTRFADRFQKLIDAYTEAGYPIRSISSYRHGDDSGPHLHGAGIDINTTVPVPHDVQAALARQFGLEAGVGFRTPDPNHYQVPLAELSRLGINGLVKTGAS